MLPPPFDDDPQASSGDRALVERAHAVARQAAESGNHPFGALLVRDGEILLEFENGVVTTGDVTRHAETGLVGRATSRLGADAVAGATLVASTEPCIMCVGAIHWAALGRVVYGVTSSQMSAVIGREYRGLPCREAFARLGSPIVVTGPLAEAEGLEIHRAFWPAFLDRDG